MGTREVYEEKLRRGADLHYDPTINRGLGTPRCPRCLSLLYPDPDKREWSIAPVILDTIALGGAGFGATLSLFNGLNTVFPHIKKSVKGPKWLPFLVGAPALALYIGGSSAFGGYVLPKFVQLTLFSHYAPLSAAQYVVSLATQRVENRYLSSLKQ